MTAAVIFDLDGVLSDTERLHVRTEQALLAELGVTLPEGALEGCAGLSDTALFERLRADWHPALDVVSAVAAKRRAMLAAPAEEILPIAGAIALVEDLAARGVPLAVASSSPRPFIERVLAALGIAGRFAAIVSGDEVPRGKPEPDVFLLAAARLGVAAGDCVVVEDAWNGMIAARRAGMRCVALVPAADRRAWPADVVVTALSAMPAARLLAL